MDRTVLSVAHESLHIAVNLNHIQHTRTPACLLLGPLMGGGVFIFRTNFYYYYIYPFLL